MYQTQIPHSRPQERKGKCTNINGMSINAPSTLQTSFPIILPQILQLVASIIIHILQTREQRLSEISDLFKVIQLVHDGG